MEIHLTARGSSTRVQLDTIGSYNDPDWVTRYGEGACGMFEASWSMPLPADFEHPALRPGALVELMDGTWRIGSPLILMEPGRGDGFDRPWSLVATGVGRIVEGENSFYARDSGGSSTTVPSVAVDTAIALGLPWGGRDTSVPTTGFGVTDDILTVGAVLTTASNQLGQRWGVGQDGYLRFYSDPTTPAYHAVPSVAALTLADDQYAPHVLVRYLDSTAGVNLTVGASAPAGVAAQYGWREFAVSLVDRGAMSAAQAQSYADGILAKLKGRMGWANGLTLTSQELLTSGGVPADLSKVAEDVGEGCIVRLHGIWNDLLETSGKTWLDIIVGEAKLSAGARTIELNPLGLAPRDLAAVVEAVSGKAA